MEFIYIIGLVVFNDTINIILGQIDKFRYEKSNVTLNCVCTQMFSDLLLNELIFPIYKQMIIKGEKVELNTKQMKT